MRKPRDFDAALKALTGKTRVLKENKRRQLGELVVATGADVLDIEMLAGGLLEMIESTDKARRENWHKRGSQFFRGKTHKSPERSRGDPEGAQAGRSGPASAPGPTRQT